MEERTMEDLDGVVEEVRSSLAEEFTTALKNKQHSLEQWPPITALPLAPLLMILV